MSTSEECIKYTLFIFNFIFVVRSCSLYKDCLFSCCCIMELLFQITGIIILSVGLSVQGVYHGYSEFLSSQFLTLPVFLITIGSIIFFVAFFACYGAMKENYCMILTVCKLQKNIICKNLVITFTLQFCGLLTIIFILELAAGITGYILKNSTSSLISSTLEPTMREYTNPEKKHITFAWDDIQSKFACCGLQSYEDWV